MTQMNGLPKGFVDLSATNASTGTTYGRISAELDAIAREVDSICGATQDLLNQFAREHGQRTAALNDRLSAAKRDRLHAVAELRRSLGWPRG